MIKSLLLFEVHESIGNGETLLAPNVNADGTWPLDMTGFSSLLIAIKPTRGGNVAINAVMGPADVSFANLSPVNAAADLRGNLGAGNSSFSNLLLDSADSLTADVWNIFMISETLHNQKLLQFKITNNSGGSSDIEVMYMRIV